MIRMIRGLRALALTVALAGTAAGCGTEETTPTAPDPVSVTETFQGTLTTNDAETHPFASGRGTVTATIMSIAPDNTLTLGFSLGIWNGLSCAVLIVNDKATQGISITGSVNGTGTLCARVYDVGTIVDPITYEVRVVHF